MARAALGAPLAVVTGQAPPRDRKPRAGGVRTRRRILTHAEKLFSQKGYRAVSLREIAKAASVRSYMIQYHFGSKRGLYEEVLTRWDGEVRDRLDPALQGAGDLSQAVDQVVENLFDFFSANPERFLLHLRAILGEGLPRLPKLQSVRLVARALAPRTEGQEPVEARLLGVTIEGILHNHLLAISRSRELFGSSADDPALREQTKAHIKRAIMAIHGAEASLCGGRAGPRAAAPPPRSDQPDDHRKA